MSLLRRIPFPLAALCLTAFLLGTTWSLLTPPFQAPDENAHFSYVDYLATHGQLPGNPLLPAFSTEQYEAGLASNSDQVPGNLATKMTWSTAAWERWQRRSDELTDAERGNSGGQVSASANPPLYYVYEALPAKLTSGGNLFTRLAWERLASMLWTLAVIAFAWLLAGEIFGRDRLLQFVTAATAGLLPMVQFVSASVTPDAMLFAMWGAVLWSGTLILKRGLTPVNAGLFLAAVGAACVVKATSYALLPGMLLVLGVGVWRVRHAGSRTLLRLLAAGSGLLLTLGLWFFIANRSDRSAAAQVTDATNAGTFHLHDFLSYLYQYYFPRFPGQGEYPFPSYFEGVPFWDVIMRGVFGTYGWTEVRMPEAIFALQMVVFAVVVLATVFALARWRRNLDLPVLAFFGVVTLALVAGLHWTDYNILRESDYQTGFNQGRYLLPLAGLAGLAVATTVRLLPERARGGAVAAMAVGLVLLNILSFGVVAWRFYA